jgi:hypothetical protein
MERGFDWRASAVDGVQVNGGAEGGMSVQLTGNQPENCAILLQFVPLVSTRKYRMTYEYSSSAPLAAAGLTWQLADAATNAVMASSPPLRLSGAPLSDQFEFTPASNGMAKLILSYARVSGTVRRPEAVTLQSVSIQAQPAGTQ